MLPRLRRFARGLTGRADSADDLVQTACVRAIDRIDQWKDGTRLDSWMYRIVQNAHIDEHRAEKSRRADHNGAALHAYEFVDGENAIEARLTLRQVRRHVGDLPEEQRSVLLLVCVEGFSYKETAEILNVPTGTVMSRLARARRKLGESFEHAELMEDNHRGLN